MTTRLERKKLIGWIRKAFSDQPVSSGIVSVKSFFLMGESGFNKEMVWQVGGGSKLKKKYKIGYEIPAFKTVLEKAAELEKIDINLVSLPTDATDLDGQLLASGMIEGRHLILQDVLSWKNVTYFLSEDQKTTASLRKIGQLSASTIPPDLQTLKDFEKKAYDSQSFAPIARKYPIAYSDTNILSCLDWTQRGELTFSPKKICEK